jgi:hypothetical protein
MRDLSDSSSRCSAFAKLVNTPYKRHVVIGEGTHTVAIEKNRMHLINQIQSFLDEQLVGREEPDFRRIWAGRVG